uniref:Uncharacterized protein n=1 Tax=Macaca nemestrina TaxID=9545 RepID=A0A2K6E543_MACNE
VLGWPSMLGLEAEAGWWVGWGGGEALAVLAGAPPRLLFTLSPGPEAPCVHTSSWLFCSLALDFAGFPGCSHISPAPQG